MRSNRNLADILVLWLLLNIAGCWTLNAQGTGAAPAESSAAEGVTNVRPNAGAPSVPTLNAGTGETVRRWDFGREDDQDFDFWPDRWQRQQGRAYPQYVQIGIQSEDSPAKAQAQKLDAAIVPYWVQLRKYLRKTPPWLPMLDPQWTQVLIALGESLPALPPPLQEQFTNQYLAIVLNGGGAMIQSPPIDVSGMYSYVLGLRIRTKHLKHNRSWAELQFLDSEGLPLSVTTTPLAGGDSDWITLQTRPVAPPAGSKTAVIRLRVEPQSEATDIRGIVDFDQIHLQQFPQLHVATSHPTGLFGIGQSIPITATAMGLRHQTASIQFNLLDIQDAVIRTQTVQVKTVSDAPNPTATETASAYGGTATWDLSPLPPGFYRVSAELIAADRKALTTAISFAIIDQLPQSDGPFGWTLPEGSPLGNVRSLPSWLHDCHVHWLKYPCWISPEDLNSADELAWLANRAEDNQIRFVGLLDQPPEGVAPEIDKRRELAAANTFRDALVWQPILEALMNRLTIKVRWWQLGQERDFSFLGRASLQETINDINKGLQGYREPLNLVISWPWLEPQPAGESRSWRAAVRSASVPLTAAELDAYLNAEFEDSASTKANDTWLLLDPLPKSEYDLATRVRDLVLRMATVQGHPVQAAFVSNPLDRETGLLRPDGTPDFMLLPWRTSSAILGSLRRTGSLQLPNGSPNIVLSDGGRTVMVLWNMTPSEESLYLGENIQVIDVWGRLESAETRTVGSQTEQIVMAGPTPKFVMGLDPQITAFRMAVKLDRTSIDSLLGRSQSVGVELDNPSGQELQGDLLLKGDDAWDVPRFPTAMMLPGNSKQTISIPLTLQTNATTGKKAVQLKFTLEGSPKRKFTVYRDLHVGPEGFEVRISSRLDENGNLVVQVEMQNSSADRLRYDCSLFPPGRQYQRKTIQVAANERVRREFIIPNGKSLLGKTMLLRAAEQDGRRVLNYTVLIDQRLASGGS